MKQTPGQAPAASSAALVARQAWRGLIQVLAGPDAPPAWWHPPWQRRAYLALSLTTLVLFVLVHILQVIITGLFNNMRSMITGRYAIRPED